METHVAANAPPEGQTVTLRVFRHNPSTPGDQPRIATIRVPLKLGMTVLEALTWAKENVEPGLAYRCSCRMGICGSCGMLINGMPKLACETQVKELGTDVIEVRPLPGFPLVRDLATNFEHFFRKHHDIKPYLFRAEADDGKPVERELLQTEEEKLAYYQFAMCIMCGLCDAACPVVIMTEDFLGPQAVAQAFRFAADSRDQGFDARAPILDAAHGAWGCEVAGSCSVVCPKGVDPALGVQLMKRRLLFRGKK